MILAGLSVASPASASEPAAPGVPALVAAAKPASCPSLHVCLYVNTQYATNQGYELIPTRPAGTCEVMTFRNAVSSAWNASGRDIRVFRNTSCTGTDYKTIANGVGKGSFWIQFGPYWDNSTDAIRFM